MDFTSSEKRQPESARVDMADVDHLRPEAAPVVNSEEKRSSVRLLWIILLLLAVVALILTAIFGHYALGPSDTIKVSVVTEQGLRGDNEKFVYAGRQLFAMRSDDALCGHRYGSQ
jgi:hypothetical protein